MTKLRAENLMIQIEGETLLGVLVEIETILLSLHKIGSYYSSGSTTEYQHETANFVDGWGVTSRLASVRGALTEAFDLTIGEDDMDDVERATHQVVVWRRPGSSPHEE